MNKKNKSVTTILVIILLVIVIVLLGVILAFIFLSKNGKEKEGPANNNFTTSIITEEGQDVGSTDPGYFTIEMDLVGQSNDGINFSGNIGNAYENTYPVYVTIVLDDTGEEVFRSGVIPIGSKMDGYTISKELGFGDHSAVVVFHQVDENDNTKEISTVNVAYTLSVIN